MNQGQNEGITDKCRGKWNRLIPNVQYEVPAVSSYPCEKRKKKKMEKMPFSAPLGLVCRRRFRCITMAVLGVESLVEHDGEG